MNQCKREELEIITGLLYEWVAKYKESYVTVTAFNDIKGISAMAYVDPKSEDHDTMDIFISMKTPGAATPRESR